jgi:hypothetical protein
MPNGEFGMEECGKASQHFMPFSLKNSMSKPIRPHPLRL